LFGWGSVSPPRPEALLGAARIRRLIALLPRWWRCATARTRIARHGCDFGIPPLPGELSAYCPKRKSVSVYDLCGIHCPDLPSLFRIPRG
jgi:hypothetical protein